MSRPKPLSKTKQLRRQLRAAQQDAQTRYEALHRITCEKQRQLEALKSRLQSIGFTSVQMEPPGDVWVVAIRVDRRAIGGLKNPGAYLSQLAADLFTKLVREMPELSGGVPQEFYANLRTLPASERRNKLMPLYDALRLRTYDDYQKALLGRKGSSFPFCQDANTAELYETFSRTLSFLSFCHLLELLEQHANLIRS